MTDEHGGSRSDARASGRARVFQAGRDQHVTEQHFHVRRSRTAVFAAVAAVAATAVAAAVAVAVLGRDDPAGGTGAGALPAQPPVASAAAPSRSPQVTPSAVADTAPGWSGTTGLTYIDLDAREPKSLPNNTGASFYVNYDTGDRPQHTIYVLPGAGIARWRGEAAPGRQSCAELISTQRAQSFPIRTGDRFCVSSGGGRVAAIRVGAFDTATGSFSGELVVWGAGS
ncbi:hypothetical protein [Streptomyces sp. NPDC090022]|uniref:hypothetical protein n=1 Tax=Streptomyces sp. NPDC090022 TaxID=3365920 RepID=UPI00382F73B5